MKKIVPQDVVLIPNSAKKVFTGVIFDVYQWQQKLFDDSSSTFEMLKRPDTVSVIGVVDNEIIVIDDTQPNAGSRTSFPGGRVDLEDGDTLIAAQREMHEETGYEFEDWRLIRVWQPHTKLEWFIYLYLATNRKLVSAPHMDAGEKIKIGLHKFKEVKSMAITKSGYLGESKEVFEGLDSLKNLLDLPEFKGQEVDR